jgi:predicted esterase
VDKSIFEYDLASESFEAFVPAGYNPKAPHGLFVWMGMSRCPQAWLDVLARHKLIMVSVNFVERRADTYAKSLDAVHNMKKRYNIDPKRVYVAGFSGGGVHATHMVQGFPDVFSGGYFLVWGGGFYDMFENEEKGWRLAAELGQGGWKGPLDQIKKDMKLVILKGERESSQVQHGRANYQALSLDGFTRVTYLEVPRLGHTFPSTSWFEKGIVALEAKPKAPPATGPTTRPNPPAGQAAYAQWILASARLHLNHKRRPRSYVEKAREYLQKVVAEYPTTPAAAEARALLQEHFPTTQPAGG